MTTAVSNTVRELVLSGDSDPARRAGRTVIAMSECEFAIPTEAALTRCVEALRASDARLALQPDSPYDWQRTWVQRTPGTEGGTIAFGVSWYDPDYFAKHRDTFRGEMHTHLFDRIGVPDAGVTVTHWLQAV